MRDDRFCHLAVRLRRGAPSLLAAERAAWLWGALSRLYPEALGAVLMPDHFHVLVPVTRKTPDHRRLTRTLAHYTRAFHPGRRLWARIEEPSTFQGKTKLRRSLRYLALNPCRAGLCPDPLAWLWSTYRDLFGATVRPWVTAARLARFLRPAREDFLDEFHAFVSADPAVDPEGTPPPGAPTHAAVGSLAVLARALAAAYRVPVETVFRRRRLASLYVRLAWRFGWRNRTVLASRTGFHPCSVNRTARLPVPQAVREAVLRCAADPRFLLRVHEVADRTAHRCALSLGSPPQGLSG